MRLSPHQRLLSLAIAASVAAICVPGIAFALLPLTYLNTHVHEACHALTAWATGGEVAQILVFGAGGGLTYTRGGSALLTSSAGYLGASAVGTAILLASRTEQGSRWALGMLAAALTLCSVLWLRGDGIGIATALAWSIGLVAVARLAQGDALLFAAQFLGIQQLLNSFRSLTDLLQLTALGTPHSDAGNMQALTGLPAILWAFLWCLASVGLSTLGLRSAWARKSSRPPRPNG